MIQGQEPGSFRERALRPGLGEKKKTRKRGGWNQGDVTRVQPRVGEVRPSFGTEEGLASSA